MCKQRLFSFYLLLLMYFSCTLSYGQIKTDSLEKILVYHLNKTGYAHDTTAVKTYYRLAGTYRTKRDSANFYFDQAIQFCDDKLQEKEVYDSEKMDFFLYMKGISLSQKGKKYYRNKEYERARKIGIEAVKLLKKLELSSNLEAREKGLKNLTLTLLWLAVSDQKQGNTEKALKYYDEIERYTYITKDTNRRAMIYGNIAVLYKNNGKLKEALEFNFKALELAEKTKNPLQVATTLGNIGVVYKHLNEYEKAESYYNRTIEIHEQTGNSKGLARTYNNLGIIARHRKQYDKALDYYKQSLQIAQDLDMKESVVSAMTNMAVILKEQDKLEEAEDLLLEALPLAEKLKYKKNTININSTLAGLYISKKRYNESVPYLEATMQSAEEMDSDRFKENAHQNYYRYHEGLGNHKEALSHFRDYIKYRDKVYNLDSKEEALEQEIKFEYKTKKISDSIEFSKQKEVNELMIKQQESELQTQRTLQIALVVILLLIMIFALFMFNRFRITHRQKNTIETQKKVVDEKNREISDSINYAKRIQEAILPSRYVFNEVMSNGFVIFKPKDVVSGDFYWIEEAHGMTFIAAADCTGHGVPGALVSVICSSALSKVLLEEGVKEPAEILNRTRELIINKFQKNEDRVNDGMDISLCAIDKANMTLHWSGANNPLWIIRSNENGNHELKEIKADKQPIGVYENQKPFTNHVIELKYNDTLYMFSDGFPDQFGGKDQESRKTGGKKYKSKPFKNFLMNIQDTPIKLQQEKIENEFYNWKGDLKQVDDVCIIGIRIK